MPWLSPPDFLHRQLISQCQTFFSHFCFTFLITSHRGGVEGSLRVKTARFLFWKVPDRLEVWTDPALTKQCLWLACFGLYFEDWCAAFDDIHYRILIHLWIVDRLPPPKLLISLNTLFSDFFSISYDSFLFNFNSTGIKMMICMFPWHHSRNGMVWLSIFTLAFGYLPLNSSWLSSVPERNVCNLSSLTLKTNSLLWSKKKHRQVNAAL